jgi:predicted dehydrogenase
LAKEKNLFLMEAMWMRFLPAFKQMLAWVAEGKIGEVRLVQADFCIHVPFDPHHRLYAPELAGGALLDLGVYPVTFAYHVLGKPSQILSHGHVGTLGTDELNSAIFVYESGARAVLNSTQRLFRPSEAFVTGTKGYIKLHDMFFRTQTLTMQASWGSEAQVVEIPFDSNGYVHQVREVHDCLNAGKIESDMLPWSDSLTVMELMDEMRKQWGVVYPEEK